jgi:hypothetical protein
MLSQGLYLRSLACEKLFRQSNAKRPTRGCAYGGPEVRFGDFIQTFRRLVGPRFASGALTRWLAETRTVGRRWGFAPARHHAAVREPWKTGAVITGDGALGSISRKWSTELSFSRYDTIMQGFGGRGENIDSLGQVVPAIAQAFASGVTYDLNVKIRGARARFTDWQIAGKKRRVG